MRTVTIKIYFDGGCRPNPGQMETAVVARDVVMLGDSAFVVAQANGKAKCRSAQFQAHFERFRTLADDFERIRVRKIARTQNLAGIALAKARL